MADAPHISPNSSPHGEEFSHSGEALRSALHAAADRVADYLQGLGTAPIFPTAAQAPSGDLLPARGQPLQELFSDAADWAEQNSIHVGHPGYIGHMDSGVAVAGVLGDFLASALNQNLLAYELAPGATLLEKKLIALFAERAGLGTGAGGIFTTGGTMANLTALLMARDAASRSASRHGLSEEHPLCVLASEEAHYSVRKISAVLGLGSESLITVPTAGPERRMDTSALPAAYAEAVARGMRPIALVATAGTTSCGAIDPLEACADFCEEHGLWMHVDGAHGGALLLHSVERSRLHGIHRADSVTLDPHKWLYVPKSAGLLLVRREEDLVAADYQAPYLDRFSDHGAALPVSQGRRAIDGSRRFDALKVWLTLRHLGQDGLDDLLGGRLALTRSFHQRLSEHAFFAPRHQPDLNVLAFAPRDPDRLPEVAAAHRAVEAEGQLWSSYTVLDGQPCHRVVLLNPATDETHLEALLSALEAAHRAENSRSPGRLALLQSGPEPPLLADGGPGI